MARLAIRAAAAVPGLASLLSRILSSYASLASLPALHRSPSARVLRTRVSAATLGSHAAARLSVALGAAGAAANSVIHGELRKVRRAGILQRSDHHHGQRQPAWQLQDR